MRSFVKSVLDLETPPFQPRQMNGEAKTSGLPRPRHRRKRRKRHAQGFSIMPPGEPISEYPGFFVLSHSRSHRGSSTAPQRRAEKLKEAGIALIIFGSFVGGLVYLFYSITPNWQVPESGTSNTFIHDQKLVATNQHEKTLWER